ncbi:MAG: helix-turn-helix transcriptional regulator [Chakrabartia sp.]
MSWRDMVQERRMNAAARLLKQSRRNVADIALTVGYSESASFVRSFKRQFGMTPKHYRDS